MMRKGFLFKMKSISVIVPAYNAENSIERCVCSVLNQDFKDFELIVVDDGSSDSTSAIVQRLAADDSRITLIRQKNGGAMAARAAGIRRSVGVWLYFLDADDTIMSDTLSSMYSHITDDIDVVVYEFPLNGKMTRLQYCRELLSFRSWWLCGKLWRRELFDERAMSVPRYFRIGEDMLTQMRLLKNIKNSVLCVHEHKYIYDEHSPTSVQRNTAYKNYEYEKRVILEVEQALACVEEDVTDDLRHWQLVYLSGMMGLNYNINYKDEWIVKVRKWAEEAKLSPRERLAIKAIDFPLFRKVFITEKSAKRIVRTLINIVKSLSPNETLP